MAAVRCAAILGLLVLAGCGGTPQEPLFPLEGGREWEYRVTTVLADDSFVPQHERLVLRADGAQPLVDGPAWRRSTPAGASYWLRADGTGVFRVASRGPLDAGPVPDAQPRYVLKKPYAVGTQWEAATTPYVLQRRNEVPRELRHVPRYRQLAMRYRIADTAARVEVPAGAFERCVQVEGVAEIRLHDDAVFAYRDVPVVTREWYCPGVGLVKQERIEHSPTKFILGGAVTLELVAWR